MAGKKTSKPENTRVVKVPPHNTDQDRGAPKVQILPERPQNTKTPQPKPKPTAPPKTPQKPDATPQKPDASTPANE